MPYDIGVRVRIWTVRFQRGEDPTDSGVRVYLQAPTYNAAGWVIFPRIDMESDAYPMGMESDAYPMGVLIGPIEKRVLSQQALKRLEDQHTVEVIP